MIIKFVPLVPKMSHDPGTSEMSCAPGSSEMSCAPGTSEKLSLSLTQCAEFTLQICMTLQVLSEATSLSR